MPFLTLLICVILVAGCSAVREDGVASFENEAWRYETLRNPDLYQQKIENIEQREIENKEHAATTLSETQRRIEQQGRVKNIPAANALPPPPGDNATEEELDAYSEEIRRLLGTQ